MIDHTTAYKGYSVVPEGHGFYNVLSPSNASIGSCEGIFTARQMVDEHIRKVYTFYERNCNLSPLQARAAAHITNNQAEQILAGGQVMVAHYEPDDSVIAASE